jgi:hypothetical protein
MSGYQKEGRKRVKELIIILTQHGLVEEQGNNKKGQ